MTFKELLEYLEERLGYHQMPLNPAATGIKDVFECSPVHPDLMVSVVRAIYAENGCRSLHDKVERLVTLDALGPIRLARLRAASTDVDEHSLIEELCVILNEAFTEDAEPPQRAPAPAAAEIIPLAPYLRQRRFKSSA